MLRPSMKRQRQLVPGVLLQQWVGVDLPLGNRHQDAFRILTLWVGLPLPRLRVCPKPDEILPAFSLTRELEQPLAQYAGEISGSSTERVSRESTRAHSPHE